MMRWIVESSLRIRYLLIVLAAMLLIYGVWQLSSMPVDTYPEFNPPLVEVQTEALGLSAEEMEALITVPLEADLLNGVAWLDQIYSETVTGLSSILLVFEQGTDPIRARQMVQERLTQTFALPNVSSPPTMLQPLSTTSRVMIIGMSSTQLTPIELGVLARWDIRPRLMGVPGVANVAIWGHRDRQLQVLVDPAELAARNVSLQEIIKSTGEALWVSPLSYLESSSPGTAGWIDTPNQRLSIRHELPISSAEDLAKITIEGHQDMLLGDVADVIEDHQPLIGDAAINNDAGLLFVIEKFPGANTLEVTRGVETALQEMAPGLKGVNIDSSVFRPANYLETAIGSLRDGALIGIALLILALAFLFFANWRAALVSLVAIPLSLLVATLILFWRGHSFNMMILVGLALALGIIIDDAIIDVENIARRLRQHRQEGSGRSTAAIVFEAIMESRDAVFFAMLITLLISLPIFFVTGLTGSFFQPLVVSYALALLSSLVITLTITPALSLILLANAPKLEESRFVLRLQKSYSGLVARTIQSPNLAYIVAGVAIVVGLATLPFLNVSLLPDLRQTDLLIEWEAVPGTSRQEMNRIAAQVTGELRSIAGVRDVGFQLGRAITGDTTVNINSAELWANLDPEADFDAVKASIQSVIDGYPGLFRALQTYQPERTGEALTGTDEDFVVRVYGDDLEVLYGLANTIRQNVAGIGGVAEASTERYPEQPELAIEVDLAAAESHHIKPGEVRRQATTLLSGLRVGNLYEANKVFDVVVWGVPEVRSDLSAIKELLISTPTGQIPLSELADIRIEPAPVVIQRDVVSRYVDVVVQLSGRNQTAVAAAIRENLQGVDFPLEYHAEVLSATAGNQTSPQRMASIVVATVIGILLLMQASFNGWRLATAVLVTLPMALSGGAVAALAGGGALSIGSLVGFLAVLGIAVRNTSTLIDRFHTLERQQGLPFGPELVMRGAQERVAPILMTTLSTILLFLPILVTGRVAGYELLHPMALVLLGGLITSAILTLLVVPALYLQFGMNTALVAQEPAGALAPSMGGGD